LSDDKTGNSMLSIGVRKRKRSLGKPERAASYISLQGHHGVRSFRTYGRGVRKNIRLVAVGKMERKCVPVNRRTIKKLDQ